MRAQPHCPTLDREVGVLRAAAQHVHHGAQAGQCVHQQLLHLVEVPCPGGGPACRGRSSSPPRRDATVARVSQNLSSAEIAAWWRLIALSIEDSHAWLLGAMDSWRRGEVTCRAPHLPWSRLLECGSAEGRRRHGPD